jgi:spore maturation protein CgeB
MSKELRLRIFAHSWISDWNHGNAHFLRGLASELEALGHDVRCYEERNSWSVTNLVNEDNGKGSDAYDTFHQAFPTLDVRFYDNDAGFARFAEEELREADAVIVHEWNDPRAVETILSLKSKLDFRVLLHDTHHRAYTNPKEILRLPLNSFDGVLAFGQAIERIYRDGFGIRNVWTFHEAADIAHFHPLSISQDTDVVWIGNWGDEERTQELEEFLLRPAKALGTQAIAVYGVRYPAEARRRMLEAGIEYRGYLPNLAAPNVYAGSKLSVHVPRRFYSNGLGGIPTIRVFEALACGAVLICAPWNDAERLFRPGEDYIVVPDGNRMRETIRDLLSDSAARRQISLNGLETILARHTCAHRAQQLTEICHEVLESL